MPPSRKLSSAISTSQPKIPTKGYNPTPLQPSQPTILNTNFQQYSSEGSKKANRSGTLGSAKGPSLIAKLHEDVAWDENDFVDDADIDLDEPDVPLPCFNNSSSATKSSSTFVDLTTPTSERPGIPTMGPSTASVQYPDLEANEDNPSITSATGVEYPTLPTLPTANGSVSRRSVPATKEPQSSQPVPWSSSPISHFQIPQPRLSEDLLAKRSPEGLDEESEQPKPAGKRRKLPWATNESPATPVEKTKSKRGRPKKVQDGSNQNDLETPKPQNTHNSPSHLWNTTASALKKEQAKHRQQTTQPKQARPTVVEGNKLGRKKVAKVFLSAEQKHVMSLVTDSKRSVFFTGSAGTGKSVLMREIISALRAKYIKQPDAVAVTASTGLAAFNIGGVTLHSYAGVGLGKEPAEDLVKKVNKNAKSKNRWIKTKVLIIDEISMVDGAFFDKLEKIARIVRKNGRPFGGIQLVVTGDFFQLPPVPDSGKTALFAFDAATWSTSINETIKLSQIFRQRDAAFADCLNEMRMGVLSPATISMFRELSRPLSTTDGLFPTELFPTRLEVDNANQARLRSIETTPVQFKAVDGGKIENVEFRDKLLQNCMAPSSMTLKVGAQVLLIKNMDEQLVNGSIGKVLGFMDEETCANLHEDDDDFDMGKFKEARAKLTSMAYKNRPVQNSPVWPYVQFLLPDGNTRSLLCMPESWKVELPNGEVQASRLQVPLILAWALSIHKAQGQTLEKVKVDLGRTFEDGQAYVALSRATCKEGLQVLRFDPKKVTAHRRVAQFYQGLSSLALASPTNDSTSKETKKGLNYGRARPELLDEYDDGNFDAADYNY